MCAVQFCPAGGHIKAKVDANTEVSSKECAAEETVLLGLFCHLYALIAALRVIALLKYTKITKCIQIKELKLNNDITFPPHSYQLLVHFSFNVSGEG